jgi:hypothetical protein
MQDEPSRISFSTPVPAGCRLDDVGLDDQVVVEELGRIGVVGEDAADLGRGEDDHVRSGLADPGLDLGLAAEVDADLAGIDAVQDLAASLLATALPTMPRWPATQTVLPARS